MINETLVDTEVDEYLCVTTADPLSVHVCSIQKSNKLFSKIDTFNLMCPPVLGSLLFSLSLLHRERNRGVVVGGAF